MTALVILSLGIAACGGESSSDSTGRTEAGSGTTVAGSAGGTTAAERALTPAEATVGPDEETAMPASGIGGDETHPPPEDPPEGFETYPATAFFKIKCPIDY